MKRLRKELSKLKNPTKPADVAKAAAVEKFAEVIVGDDLTKWSVRLKGPDGVDPPMPFAPFVGATFTVEIQFPSEYPFKAPKVKFETPIFHPNVGEPDSDLAGEICAEVLEKGWSPTLDASHIVTTLHQMLLEPNPDSPLNPEAGKMWSACFSGEEADRHGAMALYTSKVHEVGETAFSSSR